MRVIHAHERDSRDPFGGALVSEKSVESVVAADNGRGHGGRHAPLGNYYMTSPELCSVDGAVAVTTHVAGGDGARRR